MGMLRLQADALKSLVGAPAAEKTLSSRVLRSWEGLPTTPVRKRHEPAEREA